MIQSSDIWQQSQGDIHSIGKYEQLLVEKWSRVWDQSKIKDWLDTNYIIKS